MNFSRLKKDSDFKRVYNKGKSYGCKNLVLYYLPNGTDEFRVGFSISKKVGKAVVRNRIRRYLKESLKFYEPQGKGLDIIVIGRVAASESDFHDVRKSAGYLFKKTGLKIYEKNIKKSTDL